MVTQNHQEKPQQVEQLVLPKIQQKLSSDDMHSFLQRKNCQKYIQSAKDEQAGGEIFEAAIAEEDEYNVSSQQEEGGCDDDVSDVSGDEEEDSNIPHSGEDGDDEQTPKHNQPKNPPISRPVGMARLQGLKTGVQLQRKTEVINYAKIRRNAPIKVTLA